MSHNARGDFQGWVQHYEREVKPLSDAADQNGGDYAAYDAAHFKHLLKLQRLVCPRAEQIDQMLKYVGDEDQAPVGVMGLLSKALPLCEAWHDANTRGEGDFQYSCPKEQKGDERTIAAVKLALAGVGGGG